MGPLEVCSGTDQNGNRGVWVVFDPGAAATFVSEQQWVGFDLDGTLSRTDNEGHFLPPYPLGEPVPSMLATARSLIEAGVKVKIFSARACEPSNIPLVQTWAEKHGLGKLEVTNSKDFDLVRFYDDRAIQILPNEGRAASWRAFEQAAAMAQVRV